MIRAATAGLVFTLFATLACSPPRRAADRCDDVTCAAGETCDEDTGECVAPATDGGADAGADAGDGDGGHLACGGACSGETPICDEATDTCVRCNAEAGCGGETPICDTSIAGGTCVRCSATAGCGGDAPVCDTSIAGGLCSRCTATAGCGGATPVCDASVAGGLCVRCTAEEGCSGATAVCDTSVAGGECVECARDTDCGPDEPVCDPSTRRCVGCLTRDHCPSSAPVCDSAVKLCARCTTTAGCVAPTPACDVQVPGGLCVGCTSSAHCGGATPACDTSSKRCVGCLGDLDCPSNAPVCDPASQRCVRCTGERGCGGAAPVCDTAVAGGRCVECTRASECGAAEPVCDTAPGQCVQCLANSQCPAATPACDPATKGCVTCTATFGCGAGLVCDTVVPGGRCVQCTSAAQCGGAAPVCDPSTRTCVECVRDSECGGANRFCDTGARRCVQCLADAQCGIGSVCDVAARTCVTCTATKGCGGAMPVCDTATSGGRCVQCLSSGQCSGATPVCSTTPGTCVGCLADADCSNPKPVCGTGSACRACTVGSTECGAGRHCPDGSCRALPDTCASAHTVTFPAGATSVSFAADTTLAADDTLGSCNPAALGAELVYRVVLTEPRDLVVTAARGATGSANPVLYARAGACTGSETGCKDSANSAGATETLTLFNRTGEIFFFVETYGASNGPVDVTVTLAPPTIVPSNDECTGAIELSFDASGVATATGNTTLATNSGGNTSGSPTCSSTAAQTGRDVVYRYVLPQPRDVAIKVTPSAATPTLKPVVYVRAAGRCGSIAGADELDCYLAADDGDPGLLDLRNQPAGEYFLWVDGSIDTVGPFDVRVELAAPTGVPANDACAAAATLVFSGNSASATGDTYLATNGNASGDASPSCSSTARSSGKDVVYAFQLTEKKDVTIDVTPIGLAPELRPVVYLRPLSACASPALANQLACAADFSVRPVGTTAINVPAGDYAIWVDGNASTGGRFRLDVTLGAPQPPPANDACAGAQALAFSADGTATAHGDTMRADNTWTNAPGCSANARADGRDVVYSYALASAAPVTVAVTPVASTAFKPVLYVHGPDVCDAVDTTTELACRAPVVGGRMAGVLVPAQQTGTFYAWVDGASSTSGTFRIDARIGVPTNDTCAAARTVALTTASADNTIFDTTALSTDDYSKTSSPSYATACQKYSFAGKDVVFAFVAPGDGQFTASVQPQDNFDAALMRFEGTCAPGSCVAVADSGAGGGTEKLTFTAVSGQTYWFVVDGYSATYSGAFLFKVE